MHSTLVPAGSQSLAYVFESFNCGLTVETSVSEIIVAPKYFFERVLGEKNSILLHLKSLFLFLLESKLALVKSLHLVDENLIALQFDMFVNFAH